MVKKENNVKLDIMSKHFKNLGNDPTVFSSNNIASMVVNSNKILSLNSVNGVDVTAKETKSGIKAKIVITKKIENPIHFCFGFLEYKGKQIIDVDLIMERNSSASIISHCIFPNVNNFQHIMKGRFILKKGSKLVYNEEHFHGMKGNIYVNPKVNVILNDKSSYDSNFVLKIGKVGKLDIDYSFDVGKKSVANSIVKIFGKRDDIININEGSILNGESSRSLLKSRVVVKDNAKANVINKIIGKGKYSRGHVDCTEIIEGNARVEAVPIVKVYEKTSKVTHEASIGSVDKKELETLMARGLTDDEAIRFIVNGLLK